MRREVILGHTSQGYDTPSDEYNRRHQVGQMGHRALSETGVQVAGAKYQRHMHDHMHDQEA